MYHQITNKHTSIGEFHDNCLPVLFIFLQMHLMYQVILIQKICSGKNILSLKNSNMIVINNLVKVKKKVIYILWMNKRILKCVHFIQW
jgi:hypothetical protein